jgi:HEPN domain-containing protein
MGTDSKIQDIEKVYQYWLSSSDSDYEVLLNLFQLRNYNWALFLGHIVLEKLIKAYFVKKFGVHAPYLHDLRLLAKKSEIEFPDDMTMQLDVITSFNINTRYDSLKEDFRKRCTPEFANEWINKIKTLRQWIKERL